MSCRYVIGSASGYTGSDIYDGNDLIKESGGEVIAVVLQYRLGLFGFLSGSKVKAGGALNAGLCMPRLYSPLKNSDSPTTSGSAVCAPVDSKTCV